MTETANESPYRFRHPVHIPPTVRLLTALGILPFLALALAAIFLAPEDRPGMLFAQHAYGAVILSFLGGIHWGWELSASYGQSRPVTAVRLWIGILPALFGWLALLLPGDNPAVVLSLCFGLVLGCDIWRSGQNLAPPWYPALRIPVTVGVVASLVAPAVLGSAG